MSSSHQSLSVELLLSTILILMSFFIVYICKERKELDDKYIVARVMKLVPDSAYIMLFGLLFGVMVNRLVISSPQHENQGEILCFNSNFFYNFILPPIIFSSGYHLKRKLFSFFWYQIISMAFLGTIISTMVITIGMTHLLSNNYQFAQGIKLNFYEILAFASLLSSTDPISVLNVFSSARVDPELFYYIFGESVLNDAIAITLFRTASAASVNLPSDEGIASLHDVAMLLLSFILNFVVSSAIGYAFGMVYGYLSKLLAFKSKDLIVATSSFLLVAYMPFFFAEIFSFSGIVSILFTGIASRKYVAKNCCIEIKTFSSFVFHLVSFISETTCFALLGLSIASIHRSSYKIGFIVASLLLCYLGRLLNVYPILGATNLYRYSRGNVNPQVSQGVMLLTYLGGGLRGAVCFACANIFPSGSGSKELVVSTSVGIILWTVLVQGSMISPLMTCLQVKTGVDPSKYVQEIIEKNGNLNDKSLRKDFVSKIEKSCLYPHILVKYGDGDDKASSGGGTLHYAKSTHDNDNDTAYSELNSGFSDDDDDDDIYSSRYDTANDEGIRLTCDNLHKQTKGLVIDRIL